MFQSCYCYDIYHVLLKTDAVHMWCWRHRQSCWWCCRLMCNLISRLLGPSVHQMHLPFYFISLLSIASWAELTGYAGLLCWFTWRPWFVIPLSCCTTVKLRHCSLVHLIEMHGSLHVIEIVSFEEPIDNNIFFHMGAILLLVATWMYPFFPFYILSFMLSFNKDIFDA